MYDLGFQAIQAPAIEKGSRLEQPFQVPQRFRFANFGQSSDDLYFEVKINAENSPSAQDFQEFIKNP